MNRYPRAPVYRTVRCHDCGGKGYIVPWTTMTPPRECALCKGSGYVTVQPSSTPGAGGTGGGDRG